MRIMLIRMNIKSLALQNHQIKQVEKKSCSHLLICREAVLATFPDSSGAAGCEFKKGRQGGGVQDAEKIANI